MSPPEPGTAIYTRISPVVCDYLTTLLLISSVISGGCAADLAIGQLRSRQLWGQPQAVVRSDFDPLDHSDKSLADLKPSSPGSAVLRDALVAYGTVRAFVKERGIPDGVQLSDQGRKLELLYASDASAYGFALGYFPFADAIGKRPITYVEQTAINPDAYWRRQANNLRVYLDDTARLLHIGRRLLRVLPTEGLPARDIGVFVLDATPGSAKLFDLPETSHGVIVAYVDPQGPAAAVVQSGDVVSAIGNKHVGGVDDYNLEPTLVDGESPVSLTIRRGDAESSVTLAPERLPLALDIFVLNTPEVNAFTAPGLVVFTTGILNYCDDDELAFVFGHELGHNAPRQGESPRVQAALRKGGIARDVIAPPDPRALELQLFRAGLGDMFRFRSNSERREEEMLADLHAVEYTSRAGFDARAGLRFLEKLHAREEASTDQSTLNFVRTHPPAAERLQNVQRLLASLPPH